MTCRSPAPANRLEALDALRGLACLWVVLFHGHLWWPNLMNLGDSGPLAELIRLIVRHGYLGVHLFLVLSGFCIARPFVKSEAALEKKFDSKAFFKRRAYRILPAYYAALALGAVLILAGVTKQVAYGGWPDFLAHLFFVHNLHPATHSSIFTPMWSLGLEVQFYLVFPLLLSLVRTKTVFHLVLGALVLSLVTQLILVLSGVSALGNTPLSITLFYSPPARLFEFCLGMAVAYGIDRWQIKKTWLLLTAVAAMFGAMALKFRFGEYFVGIDQLIGVSFASCLYLAATRPERELSFLGRYAAAVGTISYSVYLLHDPILKAGIGPIGASNLSAWGELFALIAIFTPLCLLAGFVWFLFFEKPFMKPPTKREPVRQEPDPVLIEPQPATSPT